MMRRLELYSCIIAAALCITGFFFQVDEICAENNRTKPIYRIVIDPGHGGDDRGTVGPGGYAESLLTMDLALQLKAGIERELGLNVYLTRNEDENPGIAERAAIANGVKADLFISIHAGGSLEGESPGFNVYYQSYNRQAGMSDKDAAFAVSEEPRIWETAQGRHLNASRRLAKELERALTEVLRYKSGGSVGLPLALLKGADQPAVVIEVGALADAEAERRLTTDGYRDALARALIKGIESYIYWVEENENPSQSDIIQ